MPLVGDYFTADIEVTQAAAVEGRYGPQWKISLKVPWSQFTADNNWISQDDYKEPPLGHHHSLFYVADLKDGKDGSGGPWDYLYKLSILNYDGDESALQDAPQMGGGGAPPMPTERRPEGQSATQQPQQAQPPGNNWDRRNISIKWGQAVNLAAQTVGKITVDDDTTEEAFSEIIDHYDQALQGLAKRIFPLLIKWEQEAVDGYFAQDEPLPLTDDQSREADLRNEERVSEQAAPLPTQTQPALATNVNSLGWDVMEATEGTPAYEVPRDWNYNDFMAAAIRLQAGSKAMEKAFKMTDGMTTEDCVARWCLNSSKGYEDAFEWLKTSVNTA